MKNPYHGLTAKQELFARMSARGESRTDIMREVFGVDLATATPSEINAADCKMYRWRRLPQFPMIWREEVDRILMGYSGKAVKTIAGLMEHSDNDWLRLNASNSLLSYGRQRIFGDEQNAVHVTIEGLPELGSPDQEEQENV